MIAVINAHMIGKGREGGLTGIDWDEPDLISEEDFVSLTGESVEDFAERAPHMIVWEVSTDATPD